MINIIHTDIYYDDNRKITAIEVKLKSFSTNNKPTLVGHQLYATASFAFYQTTLLADVGKDIKTIPCPERNNVVDLVITIKESNLTASDVARFTDALQRALDEHETKLF